MDTFVKVVRTGQVPQPTQRSFNLNRWNRSFEAFKEPSIADIQLHESGLWAFRKLESIRRRLEPVWVRGLSRRQQLLMFAAGANRDCQLLAALGSSMDPQGLLVMEQVVQSTVEQPFDLGRANPDSMLLSSVDSLRLPIQMVYSQPDTPITEISFPEIEIIGRIRYSAYLAQLYSIVEGYWMHALWNEWHVDSTSRDDSDFVLPPNGLRPIVAASSQYRREVLMLEFIFHFTNQWQTVLSEEQRQRFISSLPKVSIVGDSSERDFAVFRREQDDQTTMMMVQNALQAQRGYYLPLVDEPLGTLGTINLHLLLQAWQLLYALSETLMDSLPTIEDSGVFSIAKLLKYAPTIQRSVLIKLFMSWCTLDENIAQRIVDFFSYGPSQK